MSRDFDMPVDSIFCIRGQGMVLAGVVRRGHVVIGDRLTIASPRASKSTIVAGLERIGTRELLDSARENDEVAILCRGLEVEDIGDGLERIDEVGWKVVQLTVRSAERSVSRWWKRIFGAE